MKNLEAMLATKQDDLDLERHDRRVAEEALHAQVAELEKRKEDALTALWEVSKKSDSLKNECEGI